MSVGGYWCLWVPAGNCGCLLVSEGAKWCVRVPTGVLGCLCLSEGDYWCRSMPTVRTGVGVFLMESRCV